MNKKKKNRETTIMGVDLTIIGKHSIPFKNKKIESMARILDLLNSLELEKSEFLKEMCKQWYSGPQYRDYTEWGYNKKDAKKHEEADEKRRKANEEELERCLKIHSWNFEDYDDDDYYSDSKRYYLEGTCGLTININKHFFEVSIFVNRYYHWFKTGDDYDVLWREKWRLIVYKITNILGGDYVMYFPDNNDELEIYIPDSYHFPKEMEEHFKTKIENLDQLVELISERHSKPIALVEADKVFVERYENNNCPFVLDRFEDLDKTLKI
jgi:hypothetical protein